MAQRKRRNYNQHRPSSKSLHKEDVEVSVWEGSNGEKAARIAEKIALGALIIAILSPFIFGGGSGRDLGVIGEVIGRAVFIFLYGLGISFFFMVYSAFCYMNYQKSNK